MCKDLNASCDFSPQYAHVHLMKIFLIAFKYMNTTLDAIFFLWSRAAANIETFVCSQYVSVAPPKIPQ